MSSGDRLSENNPGPSAFSRSVRLGSQHEFTAVFSGDNCRVSDRFWTVLALKKDLPEDGENSQPGARLGLAIAKKRAKRAVDRNRFKRVIRESFRQNQRLLEGYDIVVMNRDSCVRATNAELSHALQRLWNKLVTNGRKGQGAGERHNTPFRRTGRNKAGCRK